MLVRAYQHPIEPEGEGDARGRDLRQRDAEKNHAAQDEVDTDERTDQADEHARDHGVAQKKARAQDLEEGAQPLPVGFPASSVTGAETGIASSGFFVARPSSIQIAVWTSERTSGK